MAVTLVSDISVAAALKPSIAACAVAASGQTTLVLTVFGHIEVAVKLIAPAACIFGHIAVPVAFIASISENSQSVKVANILVLLFIVSLNSTDKYVQSNNISRHPNRQRPPKRLPQVPIYVV